MLELEGIFKKIQTSHFRLEIEALPQNDLVMYLRSHSLCIYGKAETRITEYLF